MSNVLAFLQNAYAASEDRAKLAEMYLSEERNWGRHQYAVRETISGDHPNFTYRVLRDVFGRNLCRSIWWENASPRYGWLPKHKFPADIAHMSRAIAFVRPQIIITFGRVASDAISLLRSHVDVPIRHCAVITAPHPAARMPDKIELLRLAHLQLLSEADFVICLKCNLLASGGSHCDHCCEPLYIEEKLDA